MLYTIKDLSRKSGLSRSTLLYYDSIGLLKASIRTNANYRKYTEGDLNRLDQICVYRQAGLPLGDIKRIMDAPQSDVTSALEHRMEELNGEINRIRQQQQVIAGILKNSRLLKRLKLISRETLISVLESAGFDEDGMVSLHAELERVSPKAHREFLESLGICDEEVKEIRKRVRRHAKDKK